MQLTCDKDSRDTSFPPSFHWMHEDKMITTLTNNSHQYNISTLQSSDEGAYKCGISTEGFDTIVWSKSVDVYEKRTGKSA